MCMPPGGSSQSPTPMPALVTQENPEIQRAVEDERRRMAAAKGRKSTILTGGMGITAPATTTPKTLLGV